MITECDDTNKFWKCLQKQANDVGGGSGTEGFSGTLTPTSFKAVLDVFGPTLLPGSVLMDAGHGLAHALLLTHYWLPHGEVRYLGLELDPIIAQKSVTVRDRVMSTWFLEKNLPIPDMRLICMAVEDLHHIEPVTHVYAAWEGWSDESKAALGSLFLCSPNVKVFVVVQRGTKDMIKILEGHGFGTLRPLANRPSTKAGTSVTLAGGGTQLQAFCFERTDSPIAPRVKKAHHMPLMELPEMTYSDIRPVQDMCGHLAAAREANQLVRRLVLEASSRNTGKTSKNELLVRIIEGVDKARTAYMEAKGRALSLRIGGAQQTCIERALRVGKHASEARNCALTLKDPEN